MKVGAQAFARHHLIGLEQRRTPVARPGIARQRGLGEIGDDGPDPALPVDDVARAEIAMLVGKAVLGFAGCIGAV